MKIFTKICNFIIRDQAKIAQRKAINAFAIDMILKLESKTVGEGRPPLFSRINQNSSWFYFKRLNQEVKELRQALNAHDQLRNPRTAKALISECCDVANFVAAIAENTKNEIV